MMVGKIVIVGPAHPYRGGIAQFNEMLGHTFGERGVEVDIVTFKMQYPKLLFPGKTQYTDSPAPEGLKIERKVNTVNPLNWCNVGREIRRRKPDLVIMKYWTPFLAPSLGTIARRVRKQGIPVVVSVDNITPHEPLVTDRALNSYFINSVDGFVYMSEQVGEDLASYTTAKPALFSPHPIYSGYGERVAREEACKKLGLAEEYSYSLFFGLIRDYKGLDLLLDAWQLYKERTGATEKRLIVAGEFYSNKDKYLEQIVDNGLSEDVILRDYFIPDSEVKYYFSAADLLIQTYWSATQSGVTQIAYNFELPMIVTNVGGLAEIVSDDVSGYVVETTPQSVASGIERFYSGDNAERLYKNMAGEKERFSWDAMADKLMECYKQIEK